LLVVPQQQQLLLLLGHLLTSGHLPHLLPVQQKQGARVAPQAMLLCHRLPLQPRLLPPAHPGLLWPAMKAGAAGLAAVWLESLLPAVWAAVRCLLGWQQLGCGHWTVAVACQQPRRHPPQRCPPAQQRWLPPPPSVRVESRCRTRPSPRPQPLRRGCRLAGPRPRPPARQSAPPGLFLQCSVPAHP
jgi:hypothetical protein